jgi:hypothetical protein
MNDVAFLREDAVADPRGYERPIDLVIARVAR